MVVRYEWYRNKCSVRRLICPCFACRSPGCKLCFMIGAKSTTLESENEAVSRYTRKMVRLWLSIYEKVTLCFARHQVLQLICFLRHCYIVHVLVLTKLPCVGFCRYSFSMEELGAQQSRCGRTIFQLVLDVSQDVHRGTPCCVKLGLSGCNYMAKQQISYCENSRMPLGKQKSISNALLI